MFDFIKHKIVFMVIGLITVVSSITIIFTVGIKPGIDFTGGTIIELTGGEIQGNESLVTDAFATHEIDVTSTSVVGDAGLQIKTDPIDQATWQDILTTINETSPDVTEQSFETIGPLLGEELLRKTLYAVIVASIALLVYIAWRFEDRVYGLTAVVAMIHDVLVILASFAVFGQLWGIEVDIMFVTATLTALAFSVHDTIVLYDRVREVMRRNPKDDFGAIVNLAINATLVRSLSTSLAITFVLVSLIVLGGESIRWFIVALLVGTLTGVYSSPFIAAPLVVLLRKFKS